MIVIRGLKISLMLLIRVVERISNGRYDSNSGFKSISDEIRVVLSIYNVSYDSNSGFKSVSHDSYDSYYGGYEYF